MTKGTRPYASTYRTIYQKSEVKERAGVLTHWWQDTDTPVMTVLLEHYIPEMLLTLL